MNQRISFSKDIYNFIKTGANKDITVLEASYRRKHPDVSKKPMSKNYYALHLIIKGSGKLITPDGNYELKKNDIFIRFPNETITYYDYENDPFNYIFITFQGSIVKQYFYQLGITGTNRIFPSTPETTALFKKMITDCANYPQINDFLATGIMHLIFAELTKSRNFIKKVTFNPTDNYVNTAVDFIHNNLRNSNLNADYVAQYLNLNTDYFLRIFKNVMGTPFSKYLIAERMNKAVELLTGNGNPISKVSEMCGYDNPSYFSKSFRAYYNQTPSSFVNVYKNKDKSNI